MADRAHRPAGGTPAPAGLHIAGAETPGDLEAVRALCWAYRDFLLDDDPSMRETLLTFYPEDRYRALLDRLPEGHDAILLARRGGVPVGCGMIHPLSSDATEVKRLYVAPDARGHGVAQALMEALIARASDTGYRMIRLDTAMTLHAARRLYDRMGFRRRNACYEVPEIARRKLCFFEMPLA
ncbi:GNAT family N-acetyltransferase [Salipiger mucosus]|uniref:Putative acetyltransferase n=1 Tax=Salipiger mucosus DSM 16094 TaxID=1123237 RepID=S9QVP0_9RHOB|nr:GNAT family N-acetyltransferase [Salipiger mucosus]EPX83658.1 putative acetyltransferase [Salipiger mucosus DSM 16094]